MKKTNLEKPKETPTTLRERERDVLHALRAAPFIAVVEIEPFALQDEGTDAILIID